MALLVGLALFLLLSLGGNYILWRVLVLSVPRPSSPLLPVGQPDPAMTAIGFDGIGQYPLPASKKATSSHVTAYASEDAIFALASARVVQLWSVWDEGGYVKTVCGPAPFGWLIRSRNTARALYRIAPDTSAGLELHRQAVASLSGTRGPARPADDWGSISIGLAIARGTYSPIFRTAAIMALPLFLAGVVAAIAGALSM